MKLVTDNTYYTNYDLKVKPLTIILADRWRHKHWSSYRLFCHDFNYKPPKARRLSNIIKTKNKIYKQKQKSPCHFKWHQIKWNKNTTFFFINKKFKKALLSPCHSGKASSDTRSSDNAMVSSKKYSDLPALFLLLQPCTEWKSRYIKACDSLLSTIYWPSSGNVAP